MDHEILLRQGQPRQALPLLQNLVKKNPANLQYRTRLFQVLCLLGDWDRAQTQLQILPELQGADADLLMAAPAYVNLIACEKVRAGVFQGKTPPLIFGEPEPWMGLSVEALRLLASGDTKAAAALHAQALESAPATPGQVDGQPFAWIADADARFGPLLEAVIGGKYYWLPFSRLSSAVFEPPSSLQDRVWAPVQLTLTTSAQLQAYLPVRYPGTETSQDPELLMAKAVTWQEHSGLTLGLGQRVLVTDQADLPLLKIRRLEFTNP